MIGPSYGLRSGLELRELSSLLVLDGVLSSLPPLAILHILPGLRLRLWLLLLPDVDMTGIVDAARAYPAPDAGGGDAERGKGYDDSLL